MTALILPGKALAYVNYGRWIAECPNECGYARVLEPNDNVLLCSECETMSVVAWPADAADIWEALQERRIPKTRNWFPVGHHVGERCGAPLGQTADQLRAEQREHEVA